MSSPSDNFEIDLACPEDSKQILELYEEMDFQGDISVMFTRRPDPYNSLMLEGDKAIIALIRDKTKGIICGMGCCIIRKAFINGEIKNVGYLTGLKVRKEYGSLLFMIRDVYRFIYEHTRNLVEVYYTTILEENKKAQKLLEKRRKNMPIYRYEGDYTVYCFAKSLYGFKVKEEKFNDYKFERGNMEGVEEFYRQNLRKYNFSPISIDLHNISSEDFFILRDKKNNILAACGLWNQQSYKQYIVVNYSGKLKYISKLPTNWLGYPSFPKKDVPFNYSSISLLCVKDMDIAIGEYFIKKLIQASGEYDLLMLGLFKGHPFNLIFNKIKHIKYKSRFYRVNWKDDFLKLDERQINIEVGLL